LQFKDATNDRRYLTDGIVSGTVLPEVNNSANNGTLINFTGTPWIDDALITINNPLVPSGAVTGTIIGFSDGPITANFGGLTIEGTVSGANIAGTLSSFVDGGLCPLLPAAAVSGTFTQGANTASITRAISVPVGLQELRDASNNPANFSEIILDDDKYLGQAFFDAGHPLTTADRSYVNPAFGLKISQDGKVEINGTDHATNPVPSLPYTTTLWIRRGADGRMYSHELTIDEVGSVVSVTPQGYMGIGVRSIGIGFTSMGFGSFIPPSTTTLLFDNTQLLDSTTLED